MRGEMRDEMRDERKRWRDNNGTATVAVNCQQPDRLSERKTTRDGRFSRLNEGLLKYKGVCSSVP